MNDLGTPAGLPDPPRPPDPPDPAQYMPRTYRAVGLPLGAGPVRNRALFAVGIPLLLVVVIGVSSLTSCSTQSL